jgi:EAL domain-containing protein (putative c-di-GMP-specific phosphodiesterase class I)/GGDEF domain-containing protein
MPTLLLVVSLLLCSSGAVWLVGRLRRPGALTTPTDGARRLLPAAGDPRATGGQTCFAVLEFDRFTAIRNTVGFDIANAIFETVGARIRGTMDQALLYRIGQTSLEFTFQAGGVEPARRALSACLDALEETIEVSGIEFRLKGKVGFAFLGDAPASIPDALVASVATALSRDTSDRVRLAEDFVRGPCSIDDLDILRALPGAITQDELTLHYQPKFDCREGTVSSAEALLRWESPVLGPVPVERIIALAERTGAVRDLTLWVVRQASRDLEVLHAAGHRLTIFVNVSGMLIADRGFTMEMLQLIREAPGKLGIEITETAVIDDPDAAIENIAAFSAAGIPVAIDDFGAGLSSLTYLKRLPADELKIDRVFISDLTGSHRDPLIVRASIDLAHALEMKVTAEGVDDPMSLSLLRVMGCDMLQGYFISRPVPLPRLISFLDGEKPHLSFPAGARSWSQDGTDVAAG